MSLRKNINRLLIGAIIGTTVAGVGGLAMTPKGRGLRAKMKRFFSDGLKEMDKTIKHQSKKEQKKSGSRFW